VAVIGGFTALMAALVALTQNDLKRVLAYSTLSQLGYMFLALGCARYGDEHSRVKFAVTAGMFHLFTHAFFKSQLFLSAGSVMHAMGNVIDMRRFSGLRKVMPVTHIAFLCGALALSGFPFLSGFWSKDEILLSSWEAAHHHPIYLVLFYAGMLTAGLTAFYTFRAYFRTFWGELVVPPEAGTHGHGDDDGHAHEPHHAPAPAGAQAHGGRAHESPAVMTIPLVILAVFALAAGGVPGLTNRHVFADFLARTPGFPEEVAVHYKAEVPIMTSSSVIAIAGIALAWLMYVRRPELPGKLAASMQGAYQMSLNKFHFDELYGAFILGPLAVVTQFVRVFDYYILDGLVDLIGLIPRIIGGLFRPVQNGLVQFYALAMMLGLTVFLLALIRAL
jgi:NADH-quinone oxidoreductase subunit L